MPATVALGAVSLGGALISANASKTAAKMQSDASDRAINAWETRTAPFADVGKSAAYTLADFYGLDRGGGGQSGVALSPGVLDAFRRSPDFQVALKEGTRQATQSAAARGLLDSGKTLKDLTSYASDLASTNIGRYLDRLSSLASLGSGSATATASGIASGELGKGEAEASGVVGGANALTSGIDNFANNYTLLRALTPANRSAYTGSYYRQPVLNGNFNYYNS